jgi:hypothetical protein
MQRQIGYKVYLVQNVGKVKSMKEHVVFGCALNSTALLSVPLFRTCPKAQDVTEI